MLDQQTDNILWHILNEEINHKYREDTFTPAMTSWSEPVVLFLLLVTQSIVSGTKNHLTVDTTVVPNKTDSDVVDEVVNTITRNCIFPDQFFLRHLAIVESTDVKDIKTQTSIKYHGGIWKVDRNKFQLTKSLQHVLKSVHEQIRKKLNINWDQVSWSDLRKPLYSGLAAALYILLYTGERGIPSGISEQALLWKTIYRPEAPTSIFLEKVSKLKLGSTLLSKHNQTFLCGKHTRNNSNIEADSINNSVDIGNAIAKGAQNPTKTLPIDDQNQLHNKSYHIGYKREDILNTLCTQKAVKEQRKFPHSSDRNKYIICNAVSMYSIRNCQDGKYFSVSQQACTQSNCDIPIWVNQKETATLDKSYPNPCKIDAERVCNLIFVSHLHDPTKFIQCDKMGNAILKTCPVDWIWSNQRKACFYKDKNQTMQTCSVPIWDNPNEVGTALPVFYPNPCKVDGTRTCDYIYIANLMDMHKFIRCDRLGQALVKSCPTSSKWNADLNKCISNEVITTPAPVITTPKPQCPIPVWDNPNEVGTALPDFYPNPCEADSTRTCDYIYQNYILDDNKFIRCDKLGQAIVKSCPTSSNWNIGLNKCISIEVITTPAPVITTPKPQCPIPVWDNPNEVGTALPDFYPNPCEADSTRTCDYIYQNYILDDNKFIRCDKLGQAIVKSCPTSSNWDIGLNKCLSIEVITTPTPVITTPKPQCPIPVWDNPNEVGTALPAFYVNPCKVDSTRNCDYIYVANLMDIHKFIRCDRLGQAIVKTCPTSSNWNTEQNKCVSFIVITTPKPQCSIPVWDNPNEVGTALPEFYRNPCKIDISRNCDYIYVANLMDIHKFIRCDRLGQAIVKTCPTSSNWNTEQNKCVSFIVITTPKPQCPIPVWDNPNEAGTALPEFYVNPCKADGTRNCDYIYVANLMDMHKFIRCDRLGQALVKSCPTTSNWNTALNKCISNEVITTPTPVITTPKPQCPIPVWDNPNEVGTALPDFYPNPCKVDSTRTCDYIYQNYILANNKFIRCDKLGQAIVKTCPTSSNWNTALNKCISDEVITTPTPVITTPKPQCPIPVWDNPNEVGTALPDFYPNPCKVDSTRTCDYIYQNYILANNKFIRCDKLGQAIVKTCPTSSNWNTALNKCISDEVITTPTPVITTPKPQCPIPVWDNPNEVGTALPDFYPNPCKVDSTRTCDYIYQNYILANNKFIRCDKLGQAIVKTCPTSSNWNTALNKCISDEVITTPTPVITTPKPQCPIPVWDNPNEVGTALPDFYPNPCEADSTRTCDYIYQNYILANNKFIRCDKLGQAIVKTCPTSSNWNTALNKCISDEVITTPTPVITTPKLQCPIPVWDNPNEVGTALPDFYPNPCEADSTRTCDYIYQNYILDDNKFIRCDKLGQAIVKSCPTSSNWNIGLNKCISIEVITTPAPVITTPKPQCPIPVWDNPNEIGTPLPNYYPNPCQIDALRLCQFIYLDYPLNDHKFIQCDRTGKALIKSCPTSRVWNSTKKQC